MHDAAAAAANQVSAFQRVLVMQLAPEEHTVMEGVPCQVF
jgi:hypothetical protein